MKTTQLLVETALVHQVIADPTCRLIFTIHSRQEMKNDDIVEADVRLVLTKGRVTWIENKKDILWHVEGRDLDGRMIRVVVVVNQKDCYIKMITAMLLK